MNNMYFYPIVTEETVGQYGVTVDDFALTCDSGVLTIDENDVLRNANDKLWNAQDNGFRLRTKVSIDPARIYGANGILPTGADIGFYIAWSNPETMQSGCIAPNTSSATVFEFDYSFAANKVTGTLSLSINAYVKRPAATPLPNEQNLMNEKGVSVGVVKTAELQLSDNHLRFPIVKVADDDKPLWWVTLDWDDPEVDRFDNSITVYLNTKYKAYPHTEKDADFTCSIIATVYLFIIKKLKEYSPGGNTLYKSYFGSTSFEEFSVCKVMHHFFSSLQYLSYDVISSADDEYLLRELQREINAKWGGPAQ